MLKDGHQPLAGNGVILSTTGEGDEAPSTLSVDWVRERVTFMDVQAVREWAAREPDQPGQQAFGTFVGEDAPERITVEANEKAKRAEEILSQQSDMHSHYDIGPWEGGFAVFRTYEIDDAMLGEYGLPTGQQVFGHAETLDQIYDAIIDGKALSELPEWVTDERMEREATAAADTEAQSVQTLEAEAAPAAEHSRWTGEPLGETAGVGQSAGGKGQSHR